MCGRAIISIEKQQLELEYVGPPSTKRANVKTLVIPPSTPDYFDVNTRLGCMGVWLQFVDELSVEELVGRFDGMRVEHFHCHEPSGSLRTI